MATDGPGVVMHMVEQSLPDVFAARRLIHADVIDVERFGVLYQDVVLDLRYLTEGVAQHHALAVSFLLIDKDGSAAVVEQDFKLLLVIFGRMGLEQVRAYSVVYHVYLMQQFNDTLDVCLVGFPNHSALSGSVSWESLFYAAKIINIFQKQMEKAV